MFSPLTTVLVKIFARGFYRVHSGLLLFSFVTLVSYCFFIEVLNQTHLPHDQIILYNLMVVLTLISSPVVVALVFIIWFALTIKCWSYVSGQILAPSNQFLFYSATSMSKLNQFTSWWIVQMAISLPILVYGLFSLVVGIVFGYFIIPVIILIYLLLLSSVSAWVYLNYSNQLISTKGKTALSGIVGNWNKPFFSLFLYHLFDRLKIPLLATKLLSYGLIAGGSYLLFDIDNKEQLAGIIALGIVMIHAVLIYESYRFESTYLSFSRNWPVSKFKLFSYWALTYLLLTLPENLWLVTRFDFGVGLLMLALNLGTGMLFRNILYFLTPDMKKYIYWVFFLFGVFFMMILLKLVWLLVAVNLITSIIVFNRWYYRQRTFLKT